MLKETDMIDKARDILVNAGWTMVGHFSGEYWTNGERRVCISKDEVRVFSPVRCIMGIDDFVTTSGKGVVD